MRSRSVSKKKKRSTMMLFGLVGLLLLIVIVSLWINYKNDNTKNDESNVKQTENVQPSESPNNLAEPVIEEEGEANSSENQTTPTEEKANEKVDESPKAEEPQQTKEQFDGGYLKDQPEPSEPTFVEGVLIANKRYPLPKDFSPGENKIARQAFEKMAQAAKTEVGLELVAFSTYRSYEYQETLYNRYVSQDGKENADRYSARPGFSEHQTGLAFDIGEKDRQDLWLTEEFGETEAGKWLVENAHKYGFILRYPKGKEAITGYMYESWHFRYLGVDLATKVKSSNLTLEEYLNIQ